MNKNMKERWENEETFTAYATIDFCYWRMEQIQKEIDKSAPKTAIDKMIDDATGFSGAVFDKHLPEIIELFESLIEANKIIERDSTKELKMLEKMKEAKNK